MKSGPIKTMAVLAVVMMSVCLATVVFEDSEAVTYTGYYGQGTSTYTMAVDDTLRLSYAGNGMTTTVGVARTTNLPSWMSVDYTEEYSTKYGSGTAYTDSYIRGTATTAGTYTFSVFYIVYHGGLTDDYVESTGTDTYTVTVTAASSTKYTYTLTLDANGGSGGATQTVEVESGEKATFTIGSTTPTRSGYTFLGWSSNPSATVATYSSGSTYTPSSYSSTLYAVWKLIPTVYTVSFSANGGTGTISSQDVESGNSITLPSSGISRSGYYLSAWGTSSSGGTTYEPGSSYTVTKDITLYAQWTANPESFDSNAPSTAIVGEEYSYTVNVTSSSNMSAWYYWAERAWGGVFSVNTDGVPDWLDVDTSTTNYVKFTGTPTSSDVGTNTVTVYLSNLSDSWKTQTTVTWIITVSATASATYTVTFNSNGGSGSQASLSNIQANNAVTLPGSDNLGYTRSGYTLFGWQDLDASGSPIYLLGSTLTITKDTTLYAYWTANPNIVVLDANGGSGTTATIGLSGSTVTLPSDGVLRSGYTLAGWYSGSVSNGVYALGYIMDVSGPIYLKAYWISDSATKLQVTYNSNGGVGTLSQYVTSGTKVVLPVHGFTKSGAEFSGWSTSTSGSALSSPYTITSATTLYARWTADDTEQPETTTYTVTFSANGGFGSYTPQTVQSGGTLTRPADPTRSGYVFTGWRVVGGSSNWDFSTGVTSSMTLEAQWEQHFTISASGLNLTLTFATDYAGLNSSIDWGDGSDHESTNSAKVTHEYAESYTGTITVTTTTSSGKVSSSMAFSVTDGEDETAEIVVEATISTAGGNRFVLDASGSSGFTGLKWILDGVEVSGDTTYTTDELTVGTHEVLLKLSSTTDSKDWSGAITVAETGSGSSGLDTTTILLIVLVAVLALVMLRFI